MNEIPDEAVEVAARVLAGHHGLSWDGLKESGMRYSRLAFRMQAREIGEPIAAQVERDTAEKIAAALEKEAHRWSSTDFHQTQYQAGLRSGAQIARGVAADGQDASPAAARAAEEER